MAPKSNVTKPTTDPIIPAVGFFDDSIKVLIMEEVCPPIKLSICEYRFLSIEEWDSTNPRILSIKSSKGPREKTV